MLLLKMICFSRWVFCCLVLSVACGSSKAIPPKGPEVPPESGQDATKGEPPIRLQVFVDQALLPLRLMARVQVNGAPKAYAARAKFQVRVPAGNQHTSDVVLLFFEHICRGCDRVVGGGPDQCKNRCETRKSEPLVEPLGWKPKLLRSAGKYEVALSDIEPLCGSDCASLKYPHSYLCEHFVGCEQKQSFDVKPASFVLTEGHLRRSE